MDLDSQCNKPFRTAMANHSCILSKEMKEQTRILYNKDYIILNGFIACIPRHNFMRFLLGEIEIDNGKDIKESTGPMMVTYVYHKYVSFFLNSRITKPNDTVFIMEPEMYSPTVTQYVIEHCRTPKKGYWQKKGCSSIPRYLKNRKEIQENAIVNHLFLNLGYSNAESRVANVRDVCHMNSTIYLYRGP